MGNHVFKLYPDDALIAALDQIYIKTRDPETKGVRDLWLTSKNLLMILLLAEVLSSANRLLSVFTNEKAQFLQYW